MVHRALTVVVLAILGCGTGPEEFGRCSAPLTIEVSDEAAPLFTWTPAECPIFEIVVEESSILLWVIRSPGLTNVIESPIRYGAPDPSGGATDAEPLVGGRTYRVRIWRIQDDGEVMLAGERTFQLSSEP